MDMKNVGVKSVFVKVQSVVIRADFRGSISLKILTLGFHALPPPPPNQPILMRAQELVF